MNPPCTVPNLLGVTAVFSDMPWLPGKLAMGLLLILSILAWGLTISKTFLLRRLIREDRLFVKRLKRSRQIMELYEQGEIHQWSPLFEVYCAGAKATALALAGTADPRLIRDHRLVSPGCLKPGHFGAIDAGFAQGESWAGVRMGQGFHFLRHIGMIATLAGFLSALWMLFVSINSEGSQFLRHVSFAITLLLVAALVAVPAFVCRRHLLNSYRERIARIRRFREQITGIFRNELQESEKREETDAFPAREHHAAIREHEPARPTDLPSAVPPPERLAARREAADPSRAMAHPATPESHLLAEHPLVAVNRARLKADQEDPVPPRRPSFQQTPAPQPSAAAVRDAIPDPKPDPALLERRAVAREKFKVEMRQKVLREKQVPPSGDLPVNQPLNAPLFRSLTRDEAT